MSGFANEIKCDYLPASAGLSVLGAISEDCKKVVVGVDFGTAYSGIAYAYKADPSLIRFGAPTSTDSIQTKVPTVLVKLSDGSWKFGNEALCVYKDRLAESDGDVLLFRRFKMMLKDKTTGMDSLQAFSEGGVRHSLMDLVTQCLKILSEFALDRVMSEFGRSLGVSSSEDVQWVLTVPAIWNEFGKAFMRRAAFNAGMISDEFTDQLMLALEPEVAALAVQEGFARTGLMTLDNRFMVVDCGGGSIDITAHQITSVSPSVTMKALCAAAGGEWGGERVNGNFRDFLLSLLKPLNISESDLALDFHEVYAEFDRIKIAFDPDSAVVPTINIARFLENKRQLPGLVEEFNKTCPPEQHVASGPALRNGYLPLSRNLMISFFEPLLASIVSSTRQILNDVGDISNLIVVGGFGASKPVKDRLFAEFNNKDGVTCTVPERPQGAIAHGAVHQGLHKTIVTHHVLGCSYGIATYGDKFHMLAAKGTEISVTKTVSLTGVPVRDDQVILTWRLFRSTKDNPVKASEEEKLGEVCLDCDPATPGKSNESREQAIDFVLGATEILVKPRNGSIIKRIQY